MSRTCMAAFLTAILAFPAAAQEKTEPRPTVDVVFVLDTTGSMGGLLEGAKAKIWSIAGTMAKGKPAPVLRVGLVAYRDKGDAYVTKVIGLTEDLDAIYARLQELDADGGGDEPENVRQGLHDALTKIEWSKDRSALKVLFLVGDAPPHDDYTDVPAIDDLCKTAAAAEIVINTIRCGRNETTGRVWQ
jgi:Mg-chelatase subunit ChlD